MIRALKLEWLKVKSYKVFWALVVMYLFSVVLVSFGGNFLLQYLKAEGAELNGIDPTILPLYDFPDVWQNLTWVVSFTKILLAYIVIISINNDLTYNILRQNIIDGLSKKEYLLSKLILIGALALLSTVVLFIAGFINGAVYSHVFEANYIFDELEFLGAYALDIFVFCSLAFLLSLLIKKAGFVIVSLTIYSLMFEPVLGLVLENAPYFKDTFWQQVPQFLPVNALNDLIAAPFPKYIFKEVMTDIPIKALTIVLFWEAFFIGSIVYILNRRDLK